MKVSLKKTLLLTLFVLVLTALFVVGANAAVPYGSNPDSSTHTPLTVDGAQIRLVLSDEGEVELRFTTTISKETYEYLTNDLGVSTDNASCGMLIVPLKELAKANAFTVDALEAAGVAFKDFPAGDNVVGDVQTGFMFHTSISVPEKDYDESYAAISYIRYTKNSEEFYIYSAFDENVNARSLKQLATISLADLAEHKSFSHRFPVKVGERTLYSRYTAKQRALLTTLRDATDIKIGNNYYQTLADALAAAQNGDVITLLGDVIVDSTLFIDNVTDAKAITIDGNGYSIIANADTVFSLSAGVTLKTQNVKIINSKSKGVAFTLEKDSGLVLNNGTVVEATQIVNKITTSNKVSTTVNALKNQFLDEGYRFENGSSGMTILPFEAQIGVKKYSTLDEALKAANAATGAVTIVLKSDLELSSSITLSKAITLDGNGHTIIYSGEGAAIIVTANGVVLKDLTVEASSGHGLSVNATSTARITLTATEAVISDIYLTSEAYANTTFEGNALRVAIFSVDAQGNIILLPYADMQAAATDANANATIVLLNNIDLGTLTDTISITKNLTIDGNGYSLNANSASVALFHVSLPKTVLTLNKITIVYNGSAAVYLSTWNAALVLNEAVTLDVTNGSDIICASESPKLYFDNAYDSVSVIIYRADGSHHYNLYATLQDALLNATDNDVIILQRDIDLGTLSQTITINRNLTIDGNSHEIKANGNINLFTVTSNITVKDLRFNVTASATRWTFVLDGSSASIEFDYDAIYRTNANTTAYRFYNSLQEAVSATSSGNTILVFGEIEFNSTIVVNKSVILKGGNNAVLRYAGEEALKVSSELIIQNIELYVRRNPISSQTGGVAFQLLTGANVTLLNSSVYANTPIKGFVENATSFVTDNIEVALAATRSASGLYFKENGSNLAITQTPSFVAQVGQKKYDLHSFMQALKDAMASGSEIRLLSDINLSKLGSTSIINKPVTINGQGLYRITADESSTFYITESGRLTLNNVTVVGTLLSGTINNNVITNTQSLAAQLTAEKNWEYTSNNGTYSIIKYVAQIGTKKYATFQDAINDANVSGGTITLLADITLGTEAAPLTGYGVNSPIFQISNTITIDGKRADGGNYKITATCKTGVYNYLFQIMTNHKNFTLQNVDISATNNNTISIVHTTATLTIAIKNSTLESSSYTLTLYKCGATATVSNSVLIGNDNAIFLYRANATVEINENSKILARNSAIRIDGSYAGRGSTVNVTNAHIFASGYLIALESCNDRYTVTLNLNAGAVLDKNWEDCPEEYSITPLISKPESIVSTSANVICKITLNGNARVKGLGSAAGIKLNNTTQDSFITFGASYNTCSVVASSQALTGAGEKTVYFADNLSDAVANAEDRALIFLLKDITLTNAVTIDRSLTIDGQDKYSINAFLNEAFLLSGNIAVTFINTNITVTGTAFKYDGVSVNTSVTLKNVVLNAAKNTDAMINGNIFNKIEPVLVAQFDNNKYTTLKAAIDAAIEAGGGTITLLCDAELNDQITLTANLTIRSESKTERYKIKTDFGSAAGRLFISANSSGKELTFENVIVDISGNNGDTFIFRGGAHIIVKNSHLKCSQQGILIDGGDGSVTVQDGSLIETGTLGLSNFAGGTRTFTITDSQIISGGRAININNGTNTVTITNSIVKSTGEKAIEINAGNNKLTITTDTTKGYTIKKSIVESSADQTININHSTNGCVIKIENSEIKNTSQINHHALYVTGYSSYATRPNITIDNSILSSNNGSAIRLNNNAYINATITIQNNSTLRSPLEPLFLGTTGTHTVTIDNSTIEATADLFPISTNAAKTDFILKGNAQIIAKGSNKAISFGNDDAVRSFTFGNYTGAQIIRKNGNDYYFYNDVDSAFEAYQTGDTVFTYNKTLVLDQTKYSSSEQTDGSVLIWSNRLA